MRRYSMKTSFALISSLCTAGLVSAVSAGTEFSAWDADGDKAVTLAEWNEVMDKESVFDSVDKNNNGVFDIEEAADSAFEYDISMDLDAGGHIERQEFILGYFNELD